jgi:Ca-activated chloride channel family protein
MNDDELTQAFNAAPEPDSNAKKRALNLAMAEFQAVQREQAAEKVAAEEKKKNFFQGFLNWWRPTGENNPNRNTNMPISQKKLIISGMATSSLVVAGMLLFSHFPLPQQDLPERDIPQEGSTVSIHSPQPVEEEVVVTGIGNQLANNEDIKRKSEADAISAEDMGALPDAMVAESMQRLSDSSIESEAPIARTQERKKEMVQAALSRESVSKSALQRARQPAAAPAIAADAFMAQSPTEFRDRFTEFEENSVTAVTENPVSTFSIDVDTASYSFVRRTLNSGRLPPKDAVRVEEMINYFDYHYPLPTDKKTPFAAKVSVMDSPWKAGNKLMHIGIKGYQIPASDIPRSNLVFLLDVSGSMSSPDKLPLVQQSMELLLDNLKPDDTISIVVYAGAAGTVLEPTAAKEKQKILTAIQELQAGGSTAGAQGIQLAYQLAEANFDAEAVNRIILATDGDFNVGHTGDSDLKTLVERKRDRGIYLSVLGFGTGNYQDAMMQTLAQSGNGVAAYIDTLSEAQKVLVHEATSMLFPIANDVKIQVEFNPATVAEYRLIGYETRALQREDFANDKVDAGDIGAGHTVTAIYEITPVGGKALIEPSRYQTTEKQTTEKPAADQKTSDEYAFLRIRYKLPGEKTSQLIEQPIGAKQQLSATKKIAPDAIEQEVWFATAVAGFAQLLRGSKFVGEYNYDQVIELAQSAKGSDHYGYRTEFIQLVRKAKLAKEL